MKNLTKIILISILGLVVSAGLVLFLVRPILNKVGLLKKEVSAKKAESKQLDEQIVIYKNSQRDLSLATEKEMLTQSMLVRENLQVAIEEIENAAVKTGTAEAMTIHDDSQEKVVAAEPVKQLIDGKTKLTEVAYTVSTTSDFSQMIDFLRYIEHLPHFTEVSSISLQTTVGEPNLDGTFIHSGTVIGNINLVFFVQKQ